MDRVYSPLALHPLRQGARLTSPDRERQRVRHDTPATAVMTDLRQVPAASIDTEAPIDAANRFMMRRGVRLLLVADDERRVLGLITASDILGEKPVMLRTLGLSRQDLRVAEVAAQLGRLAARRDREQRVEQRRGDHDPVRVAGA